MTKKSFADFYKEFPDAIDTLNVSAKKKDCPEKAKAIVKNIHFSGIEYGGKEYKKDAKNTYIELMKTLCKDKKNYEKLSDKNWFHDSLTDQKNHPKIGNKYLYCDCNIRYYMLKCLRALLDLEMLDEMKTTFFLIEDEDTQSIGSDRLVKEESNIIDAVIEEKIEYKNDYSRKLLASKNLILRGAPGTGKTHLAYEIASDLVSYGRETNYELLTAEEKARICFVQFHPSYDYTDFVEGLRPRVVGKQLIFELKKGIFMQFVENAKDALKKSDKKYVFIIDEINRGEISKVLGELFFSIDPGYRGEKGAVFTQYANMHKNPDEKFFVPENLYLIGTMNDIDRSVDSFDFAMRRRFRFVKIKADESQGMLNKLDDGVKEKALSCMNSLNASIVLRPEFSDEYQIGASYFLKLREMDNDFNTLWNEAIEPLLRDYVKGISDEDEIMEEFKDAFDKGIIEGS